MFINKKTNKVDICHVSSIRFPGLIVGLLVPLSLIFLDLVIFNYIIGPICTLVRLGLFVAVIANYVAVTKCHILDIIYHRL